MSDLTQNLKDALPTQIVALAKALRKTLDPWEQDDMPVGPSTRVRKNYVRCLSLTETPIIQLQYVKGIPSRREPNGWELHLPRSGEGVAPFLNGRKSDEEALKWANQILGQEGWIFER